MNAHSLPTVAPTVDPLLALIRLYRDASAAYEAGPDDDPDGALAAATYEPPLLALEFPPAPTTMEGALAGLDFVQKEMADHVATPPCKAVLSVVSEFLRTQVDRQAKRPATRFMIKAMTDRIGVTDIGVRYAEESLLCEPVDEFTEGLYVIAFADGGTPKLVRMRRPGRDVNGRFVTSGSPQEAIDFGFFWCRPDSIGRDIILLGGLVDQSREYPRTASTGEVQS